MEYLMAGIHIHSKMDCEHFSKENENWEHPVLPLTLASFVLFLPLVFQLSINKFHAVIVQLSLSLSL